MSASGKACIFMLVIFFITLLGQFSEGHERNIRQPSEEDVAKANTLVENKCDKKKSERLRVGCRKNLERWCKGGRYHDICPAFGGNAAPKSTTTTTTTTRRPKPTTTTTVAPTTTTFTTPPTTTTIPDPNQWSPWTCCTAGCGMCGTQKRTRERCDTLFCVTNEERRCPFNPCGNESTTRLFADVVSGTDHFVSRGCCAFSTGLQQCDRYMCAIDVWATQCDDVDRSFLAGCPTALPAPTKVTPPPTDPTFPTTAQPLGITLPPGFTFPPGFALIQKVIMPNGEVMPVGTILPEGFTFPPDFMFPPDFFPEDFFSIFPLNT